MMCANGRGGGLAVGPRLGLRPTRTAETAESRAAKTIIEAKEVKQVKRDNVSCDPIFRADK